jgi:hypothetical protein
MQHSYEVFHTNKMHYSRSNDDCIYAINHNLTIMQHNYKYQQDVLGRSNHILYCDMTWIEKKQRIQQFSYCGMRICGRCGIFSEALPNNDRGIYTQTYWRVFGSMSRRRAQVS